MADITEYGYNLNELAQRGGYEIDIEKLKKHSDSNYGLSDKAAVQLISYLTQHNSNLKVEYHPYHIFNGKSVDDLPLLYDTKCNMSDVGVVAVKVEETKEGRTTLVTMEVNSSPMETTIVKTIHGLIQLGRVIKAQDVHNEDLVGFAVPKLNVKGAAVKVNLKFDSSLMAFTVTLKFLKCSDFPAELQSAICSNLTVLTKCKRSTVFCKEFLICLSEDDMKHFGANPVQSKCNSGLLLEAGSKQNMFCLKKPIFTTGCFNVLRFVAFKPKIPSKLLRHVLDYEVDLSKNLFQYRKVTHNPLSYLEAEKCLHALLLQVHKICEMLFENSLLHSDIRLPNICFDFDFNIVLIDFDDVEFTRNLRLELSIFANDVIAHAEKDERSKQWIKKDKFLLSLCEGEWRKDLLEMSLISSECLMCIEDVIKARPE